MTGLLLDGTGVRPVIDRVLPAHPYTAEEAIHDASWSVGSISLDDLVEAADLQTRVDRKYFVPAKAFRMLIAELSSVKVLEIDGRRTFDYESVYFDTPDVLTYRAHLQRRRRRFKARTRTYVDSGLCMFEVKTVGRRGATVKDRVKHPVASRAELTDEAQAFLTTTLRNAYDQPAPAGLRAMLTSRYRRTTFASPAQGARLTCDVALLCHDDGRATMRARDSHVLVESKSTNGASEADQMLRRLGVRPISVSKYCVGIAALRPEVPANPWRATLVRYFEPAAPAQDSRGPQH
ncbi:MAG: polyphosphate polymerase domain-containing protein [Pseudonocardia sp.]